MSEWAELTYYDKKIGALTLVFKCSGCGKTLTIRVCAHCVKKLVGRGEGS